MKKPDKTTKESLRYVFSDAEITAIAREQGQKLQDKQNAEEEKKLVTQQYKLRIDTLDGEIEASMVKINNGYEMRLIECGIYLDDPEPGQKRVVRMDTGETVRFLPMEHHEKQRELPLDEETDTEADTDAWEGWTRIWDGLPDMDITVMTKDLNGEDQPAALVQQSDTEPRLWACDNGSMLEFCQVVGWRDLTEEEAAERGEDAEEQPATAWRDPEDVLPDYDEPVIVQYVDGIMESHETPAVMAADDDGEPIFIDPEGDVIGIGDVTGWRVAQEESPVTVIPDSEFEKLAEEQPAKETRFYNFLVDNGQARGNHSTARTMDGKVKATSTAGNLFAANALLAKILPGEVESVDHPKPTGDVVKVRGKEWHCWTVELAGWSHDVEIGAQADDDEQTEGDL